jgi:Fe-S oxidoreductase
MEWKMSIEHGVFVEKYDLLGCIQCGRCTGGCPVTVRTPLNVRRFVYDTVDDDRLGELSESPDIWDCTTCNTCAIRCPKGLEPFEVLLGLRAMRAEEGNIEPTAISALESMFNNGNPWGKAAAKRVDWMEGVDGARILEEGEKADILFHVCCTAAYDPKIMPFVKKLVRVLNAAGVDFGFIGEEEKHCGSEARRLGEEGLFEYFDEENTELFGRYDVKRLVTLSPHCFNSFKNEYTNLNLPVMHYTQLIAELLEDGKLELTKEISSKVVFHDPCYLGKKNLVFDEPRYVLGKIKGVELAEFYRSKERSLCCEGGGGKMWVESESKAPRLAETRVADAHDLGAQTIAVACPFCWLTIEDAIKAKGFEEEMQVKDILELLDEAL